MKLMLAVLTRERPRSLARCLASIAADRPPPEAEVDVLVVDNGSPPPILIENQALVATSVGPFPARLVVEDVPGIPAARNRALDEATRAGVDAILFLDDDQAVEPGWLRAMVAAWREEQVDIVKSAVHWEFEPPARFTRFFEQDDDRPRRAPMGFQIATNGVLIDRRIWSDLGIRFDARLAYSGGTDVLFFRDALAEGARAIRIRDAVAIEYCPAAKQTPAWLLRRAWRVGAFDALVRLKPYSRGGYFVRGLGAAMLRSLFVVVFLWSPSRSFDQVMRLAKAIGRMAGALGVRPDEYRRVIGD